LDAGLTNSLHKKNNVAKSKVAKTGCNLAESSKKEPPHNPLVEDYADVFYMIHKGDVPSVQSEMNLRRSMSMREVDGPSFILIDFNVVALASRLS
jgi:hypothetical protein